MTDFDDPPRLADSTDTPPELRNLLSSARSDLPDDNQVKRVAARLGPLLGLGAIGVLGQSALTASGTAAQGGAGATAVTAVGIGKIAGVVLLGGALAGGAWWWSGSRGSTPAPSAQPSTAPRTVPVAASPKSVAASPVDSTPVAAPSAADSAQEVRSGARPAAPMTEAQLLQRARAALATDPALALRLTEMHKARFGSGQLAQEREVIAIDALERLKRTNEAKQRATQFHSEFPDSVHQHKVDEIAH
jgi:hypothetical protein